MDAPKRLGLRTATVLLIIVAVLSLIVGYALAGLTVTSKFLPGQSGAYYGSTGAPRGFSGLGVVFTQAPSDGSASWSSGTDPAGVCPTNTTCGNPSVVRYNLTSVVAGDYVEVLTLQWQANCAAYGFPPTVICADLAPPHWAYEVTVSVGLGGGVQTTVAYFATPPSAVGGWPSPGPSGVAGNVTAQVQLVDDVGNASSPITVNFVSYAISECSGPSCP
jgi:hypothetical protein